MLENSTVKLYDAY